VLASLDATPQRRPWWPPRRFAPMNRVFLTASAAAAVLVVVIIGYNLLPRTGGVGTQPTVAPSPSSSPPASPSPTAAPTSPIIGTWATGGTTCARQLAAIEAAGFSADQMTSVGVDRTCANGITVPGAGWRDGTQNQAAQFFPDGRLVVSEFPYADSLFTYRLIGGTTFEATDALGICLTFGYAIAGDQLTIQIVDTGCAATGKAPLLDQIGLTVFFETSPYTRQP
jgi:hypothetical protein